MGEPTACIISLGTRKMPLPMMVPTTMAVAWLAPSARGRSNCDEAGAICETREAVSGMFFFKFGRRFCQHQAYSIADGESDDGSNRYQPGKSDPRSHNSRNAVRAEPQVDIQSQSARHPYKGSEFVCLTCEHTEQKYPEECAISHRDDRQPNLHHAAAMPRKQRQPEKN